jgi:O-antigen/teichoic acid export membrane protein
MIARKSLLIVTSQLFARLIGVIGLLLLAKLWGDVSVEALGIIGFAMSFLALFNILADFGFSSAHIKRVSEGKDLGTCIGTYATIKILLTGLMVVASFSAIFLLKNVFDMPFHDATTESVIFVFIVYYVFLNIQKIATITFEGRREIAKQQITTMFENIVKVPLMIFVALAGVTGIVIAGEEIGIPPAISLPHFLQPIQQSLADHAIGSLAMAFVFGMMATVFVGMWLLRKYPLKKPNLELCKSYFSFALPIALLSVIGVISANIDKLMIGYFWTSTEVGYYFTVQQILNIIIIFSAAISTVLFPTFSEYHANKNFEKIKQTTRLAERYISMVMIPPIVAIIVFVNPLINIMLDSAFLPAAPVLIALAIYTFISALRTPFVSLIGGMNRPGIAAKIGGTICVVNIVLNYLFIPKDGLLSPFNINGPTGAAIATILSISVGFIGLQLAAKKLTGIKLLQSHTPRHIIAGFIMGAVLYYLAYRTLLFPVIQWYTLLVFSGIGLGIYLAVLFVLKEFKKKDLFFFLDLLHPKEMLRYIKSELKGK